MVSLAKASDKEIRLVDSRLAKYERQAIQETMVWMKSLKRFSSNIIRSKKKVTKIPKIANTESLKKILANLLHLSALTGVQRTNIAIKNANIVNYQFDTLSETLAQVLRTQNASSLRELKDLYEVGALETLAKIDKGVDKLLLPLINDIVENKLTTKEGLEILDEELARSGFSPRNSYTIENILRTQSSIIYNASKWRREQEVDAIWGYSYQTMEDDRVRDEHRVLQGVMLPKDHKFWDTYYPPNGWSCRCIAYPLFRKPRRIKNPPKGITIHKDFSFNPGKVFS